jgi:hypothetical protein
MALNMRRKQTIGGIFGARREYELSNLLMTRFS